MKELSEGLQLKPEDKTENSDSEDDDPTVKSVNPPVKNEKKTLQKRRKQKEQRQLALQLREQKVEKKKRADLYKLKFVEKQMEKKENKEKKLRELREKNKKRKAVEPKVLSKVKFEAAEPDFKLGGELSGNLRNSEPVGNLLKDRYKSLQQRNIVAPGTLVLLVFFFFSVPRFVLSNFSKFQKLYSIYFFILQKTHKGKCKKVHQSGSQNRLEGSWQKVIFKVR